MLSSISIRLVKLTGKSKYRIHPKHLIKIEKPWYLKNINKIDSVLDLGCNNGQHSLKIARKCRKVVGVDYDRMQLQIARESSRDKGIKNVKFIFHNLEKKLSIKNNSFDKILCLDVLEHIVNRKLLLKEIKRILKPEGIAFIAIPNTKTSWKKLQKKVGLNYYSDPDHKIEYSLESAKKTLNMAGFEILSLKPVVYDTPWVGIFDVIGGLSLRLYSKISLWKKNKVKNNLQESTGFRIMIKIKK